MVVFAMAVTSVGALHRAARDRPTHTKTLPSVSPSSSVSSEHDRMEPGGGELRGRGGGGGFQLRLRGGLGPHPTQILKSFGSPPQILKSFGSVKSFGSPPPPPPPKETLGEILPFSAAEGLAVLLLALVTHLARPDSIQPLGAPRTPRHVFYFGWIGALSTGLGAILPLICMRTVMSSRARAQCGALAGGVMLSGVYHLLEQVATLEAEGARREHILLSALGFVVGVAFVAASKAWLKRSQQRLALGHLRGTHLRSVLLVVAVMVLHSCSEGLAIGMSFTGKDGVRIGAVFHASMALHNLPQGLALALVLAPRGFSKLGTVLCSICTSVPQPLLAVGIFLCPNLFAAHFAFWQSLGLGFGAGSMFWVALTELLGGALHRLSKAAASFSAVSALAAGYILRHLVPEPT
eukprot:Tamp_19367.p1 GENE.Tamp_19367~~Tamp_19367.p1  ORF type:complete len:407 (+),score=23.30 Tamp_19367:37-1257(+)